MKERLIGNENLTEIFIKLADGNPGAVRVLMEILEKSEAIDPECGGPILNIYGFDTHGIYGPNIWTLYTDLSRERLDILLMLMRSAQLGLLSHKELQKQIALEKNHTLDLQNLYLKVKKELPGFAPKWIDI